MTIDAIHAPVGAKADLQQQATSMVFSGDADDEAIQSWGPVLSVFGSSFAAVLQQAESSAPESFGLADEVFAAARRYGALLEVVCSHADVGKRPFTVYDCCQGFSVLMLPQLPVTAKDASDAVERFELEKTSVDEKVFSALMSRALADFFRENVAEAEGLVTVTVGGSDYCFMRSGLRDVILQKLHIASSAEVY